MISTGPTGILCGVLMLPFLTALPACSASAAMAPAASRAADIPALNWQPRSDWVNVQTGVEPKAKGDGLADDTPALQAALGAVKTGTTVYLPAGTYRITQTLNLTGPLVGVSIIGHGRDTKLVWDGAAGGTMLRVDGVAYSRYVGLDFEGRGKAALGLVHSNNHRFETEVTHRHLAFRDFTDAAILRDPTGKHSLAEALFDNCLFEDCRRGVVFEKFNDYDFTFDGCEFRRCETAVLCNRGNFYIRNCHFERSRAVDIQAGPEHGSSVRRCTSSGSNMFVRFGNPVATLIVQDCRVDGWKNSGGAITLAGGPVQLFDCVFTNPPIPATGAPVAILDKAQLNVFAVSISQQLRLLISGNVPPPGASLLQAGHRGFVTEIPLGKRSGLLRSAHQTFLQSSVRIPRRIFDVKQDFGAKGDGKTDDTSAIQSAIDAAASAADTQGGADAMAYLPTGKYVISRTLRLSGHDFYFGGSGFSTSLVWKGEAGGTMLDVREPQRITLEQIAIGNHDAGPMNNAVDIQQTGTGRASRMTYDGVFAFGMYQKEPRRKGFHFTGLSEGDVVVMPHVQGNMRFTDCARATILANTSYEGSITVEGKDRRRGGLLGFQTRLATIVAYGLDLRDSQSIVMSDFYLEQSDNGFLLSGAPDDPPGRATIQSPKVHYNPVKDDPTQNVFLDVRNYKGQVFMGPSGFYQEPKQMRIRQQGENPFDLFLLGCSFYDTRPDLEAGPAAHLFTVGSHTVGMKTVQYDPSDVLGADTLAQASLALDDLRRLGEADLRLNHPEILAAR